MGKEYTYFPNTLFEIRSAVAQSVEWLRYWLDDQGSIPGRS